MPLGFTQIGLSDATPADVQDVVSHRFGSLLCRLFGGRARASGEEQRSRQPNLPFMHDFSPSRST